MSIETDRPFLGYGLGLRTVHYESILSRPSDIDWLEILSENYMVAGGKALYYLDRFRERYPLAMHGVSMSIGSTDPLDMDYLKELKTLADRVDPLWISDHMCWTGVAGTNLHDLMPLPYNADTARHAIERVKRVQDFLERRIMLENVSSYLNFKRSDMAESDFMATVAQEADCLLLLDINNIAVSAFNHGFDPLAYMRNLPRHRVGQFHLAGHEDNGDILIDTHDQPVGQEVWDLYGAAVDLFGAVSTSIERDDNIPDLDAMLGELRKARRIGDERLNVKRAGAR